MGRRRASAASASAVREVGAGRTSNPEGLVSGALWASFFAGAGPGVHGQWDGIKGFDPKTYRSRHVDREDLRYRPFFTRLSDAGKRVGVIDATHTFLYEGLNGFQVVDWMTHLRVYRGGPMRTTPPDLAQILTQKFGDDPFPRGPACATDAAEVSTVDGVRDFLERIHQRIERKRAAANWLLEREPLDFFFVNLDMAHDTGHMLWHVFDTMAPNHRADLRAAVGDPMLPVYRAIDAAVGELTAAAGEDCHVLVYLSHGMTRSETATYTLDAVLRRLEAAYFGTPDEAGSDDWRTAARSVWRKLPKPVRDGLARKLGERRSAVRSEIAAADRRRRRFFEIYMFDSAGAVRINLAGRESEGMIQPGSEYRALLDRLAEDLRALRNADTGGPVIDRVIVTDEHHSGPNRDLLPDLLIEWNRDVPITRIQSDTLGVFEHEAHGSRSGDHSFDGHYFFTGPRVTYHVASHTVPCTRFADDILRHFGVEGADDEAPDVLPFAVPAEAD